jgi:hypothetical protein
MVYLVGCASFGSKESGIYHGNQKVGDILSLPVIRGQMYMIIKMDTSATYEPVKLGVTDEEIPKELLVPSYEYTLSKEGSNVGISGIFPSRTSADQYSSKVIIPKRHVERLLKSTAQSMTFRITDP